MKVYILSDLEGVSGVHQYDDWERDNPAHQQQKARMAVLLVEEINAAVEGALSAGVEVVVVRDGHGYGDTIPIEELHPAAQLSQGRLLFHPLPHLDSTFQALVMVGQHARAGNQCGCLSHTYSRRIRQVRVNGVEVGEIAINAALAADLGVPTVFVSGDSEAVSEAKSLLPDVEVVETKVSHSVLCALSLSPQMARNVIRQGVQRALQRLSAFELHTIEPPVELVVTYKRWYAAGFRLFLGWHLRRAQLRGVHSLVYRGQSLTETWQIFTGAMDSRISG